MSNLTINQQFGREATGPSKSSQILVTAVFVYYCIRLESVIEVRENGSAIRSNTAFGQINRIKKLYERIGKECLETKGVETPPY